MTNKLVTLILIVLGSAFAQQTKSTRPAAQKEQQSEFAKDMTPIKSTLEFYIGLAKNAVADVEKKKVALDKEMGNKESRTFNFAAAQFARSCQGYFSTMAEVSSRAANFSDAMAKKYEQYEKGVKFDLKEADAMLGLVESEVSSVRKNRTCQETMPKLGVPEPPPPHKK